MISRAGSSAPAIPATLTRLAYLRRRLVRRNENLLEVEGVDMFDGTPLLDIKPYVPDFDIRKDVRTGWYATRSVKE